MTDEYLYYGYDVHMADGNQLRGYMKYQKSRVIDETGGYIEPYFYFNKPGSLKFYIQFGQPVYVNPAFIQILRLRVIDHRINWNWDEALRKVEGTKVLIRV